MNTPMPRREAERRFLLKRLPELAFDRVLRIRQFYVWRDAKRRYSARFRHVADVRSGVAACFETHKIGGGLDVIETEYPVAVELYDAMKPLYSAGREIEKHRHVAARGGLTWEIDVFESSYAGLVVAEVELDDPAQPLQVPEAFGPWIEVTGWPGMKNVALSFDGLNEELKTRLHAWYGRAVWEEQPTSNNQQPTAM